MVHKVVKVFFVAIDDKSRNGSNWNLLLDVLNILKLRFNTDSILGEQLNLLDLREWLLSDPTGSAGCGRKVVEVEREVGELDKETLSRAEDCLKSAMMDRTESSSLSLEDGHYREIRDGQSEEPEELFALHRVSERLSWSGIDTLAFSDSVCWTASSRSHSRKSLFFRCCNVNETRDFLLINANKSDIIKNRQIYSWCLIDLNILLDIRGWQESDWVRKLKSKVLGRPFDGENTWSLGYWGDLCHLLFGDIDGERRKSLAFNLSEQNKLLSLSVKYHFKRLDALGAIWILKDTQLLIVLVDDYLIVLGENTVNVSFKFKELNCKALLIPLRNLTLLKEALKVYIIDNVTCWIDEEGSSLRIYKKISAEITQLVILILRARELFLPHNLLFLSVK